MAKVRLLKHWRCFKPGKVFTDLHEGSANELVKRGRAVRITDAEAVEQLSELQPANRDELETASRRPGRPRKPTAG